MKTKFNYRKFNNEAYNTLVESFVSLCEAQVEGKGNTAEYQEANKQFNLEFMKECYSAMPNAEVENFDLEELKNPMVHNDMFFQHRFDTLLSQMITPVVPTVIASGYAQLYDVTQVGYGVA